jgi:hypothetical protein
VTDPKLNLNPFVLPGMGQNGESASNPLFASMEMMRQAMSGLAQVGSMGVSPSLAPTLNPEELERRIQELKVVENWLKLNLSMLSSTIQGMEVQLATISTIRAFVGAGVPVVTPKEEAKTKSGERPSQPVASPEPAVQAMPTAAKAWWDMLETQFKQVAAATAATLSPKHDAASTRKGKHTGNQTARATESKTVRKTSARKSGSTDANNQKSSNHKSGS